METDRVPIYEICGHRYQSSPQAVMEICTACEGMFAVGLCSRCGAARCGEHSGFLNGKFVCDTHIAEAAQEKAQQDAQERAEAKEAAARERSELEHRLRERIEREAPGFPKGPCAGLDMSTALERLVPSQLHDYVVGYRQITPRINYRHWGPAIRVEGWGFGLLRKSFESNVAKGYHGLGLIVSRTGVCFKAKDLNVPQGDWSPSPNLARDQDWLRTRMDQEWLIPAGDVQTIREKVLAWRGVEN